MLWELQGSAYRANYMKKIWTKDDPKRFKTRQTRQFSVLRPYFCSYACLVCGGLGFRNDSPNELHLMSVDAHSSTLTPVFLTSRRENQTMVRAKLRTKTQTTPDSILPRERRNSDHGLSFWGGNSDPGLSFWGGGNSDQVMSSLPEWSGQIMSTRLT